MEKEEENDDVDVDDDVVVSNDDDDDVINDDDVDDDNVDGDDDDDNVENDIGDDDGKWNVINVIEDNNGKRDPVVTNFGDPVTLDPPVCVCLSKNGGTPPSFTESEYSWRQFRLSFAKYSPNLESFDEGRRDSDVEGRNDPKVGFLNRADIKFT